MPRSHQSLIGPATAMALAAAVLVPLIGGWQILRDRDATLADERRNIQTLTHAVAEQAARVIQSVDLLLADVVERAESGPAGADLQAFLQRRSGMLSQSHSFGVIDSDGRLVADSRQPHTPITATDRPYFIWHRDHTDRGLHFDTILMSRLDNQPAVPMSRRIDRPDGSFGGVAAAALLPGDFQAFYNSLQVGPHGLVALWGTDATLLVRRPVLDQHGAGLVRSGNAAKFGPDKVGVVDSVSSLDGIRRIMAFEHVGDYPLIASVAMSFDDVLGVWRHESVIQGAALGAASAALLLLAFGFERGRRIAREEALLRQVSDQRYRLLAQNASDLVLLKPVSSDMLSYVSPSSLDMLGWEPDELAALPMTALIHPEDLPRVLAELASLSAGTSSLTSIHRLRHKSGDYVRVEARLRRAAVTRGEMSVIVAARDVTARYDAEAQYRTLADSTSDVITQIGLDMKRRYVSPSCRLVLGYTPDMLLGNPAIGPIHAEDRDRVMDIWARLAAGLVPEDRVTTTYRVRHREGHWIWGESAISLVRSANGSPAFLISSLRDISERQRAARHLERAKVAAENAALIKSEFVANMSHELRTPLTGILGIHDLLQADRTLSDRQRRYVAMAHDAGRSLLAIVNDVLDFSKIEAGELVIDQVSFDVRTLVETCLDLGREPASRKALSIRGTFADLVPAVEGDPNRIRQVLLNLLMNAIKFTERGGVVVEAAYDRKVQRLRVEVSDTGVGVSPDKLAVLFERFTQADATITRRFGGTGLGLAISKRLVELMGGTIGVDSQVGSGSTFWFELPLPTTNEAGTSRDTPGAPVRSRPCHVLLAEDNQVNQDIIAAMLRTRGHEVTLVSDGAAAIAALEARERIDIVLMDLQMPVMDGLSATAAIREAERRAGWPAIPIFGLTANAMMDDVERCLAAGMNGHIPKPIDWDTLFAAIAGVETLRAAAKVPAPAAAAT